MKKKLKIDPWIVATVLGLYFLPVGLAGAAFLGWREFSRYARKNKTILYCGIATVIYSVTMTAYTTLMPTGADVTIPAVVFGLPSIYGIAILCLYIFLTRRADAIARLYLLVQQEHITSIPQLCQITGFRREKTVRLLHQMIRLKMLDGAWIDESRQTVCFRKSIWTKQRFICDDCGAELIVDMGHTLVCEFCGSALSHR